MLEPTPRRTGEKRGMSITIPLCCARTGSGWGQSMLGWELGWSNAGLAWGLGGVMLGWAGMLLGWDQTGIKAGTSMVQRQTGEWDGMMVGWKRTEHERGMGCCSPHPTAAGP